ncbi:MAG: ATP synthase F1 subunit epsilon [Cyclobacteriaceae bacterium]|nr:ATP synthase F1 subunit epsilon [Cyclobacteriaceae bacterium]
MSLHLDIVTPDAHVYQGEVESATFPGSLGTFQVLIDHAPIISALTKGTLVYVNADGTHSLEIDGGVVEVLKNNITVLAESIA